MRIRQLLSESIQIKCLTLPLYFEDDDASGVFFWLTADIVSGQVYTTETSKNHFRENNYEP